MAIAGRQPTAELSLRTLAPSRIMSPWVPPYRGAYGSLGLPGLLLPEKETGPKGTRSAVTLSLDDVVRIFEIDPTSDSSPWGRRASASLQPGETTFETTKLHASSGKEKRGRAHRRFGVPAHMVERIKAYFQVRLTCVRTWW